MNLRISTKSILIFVTIIFFLSGCSSIATNKGHTITTNGNWTSIDDELFIVTGNDGINMVLVTSEQEAALIDLSNDKNAVDQILNYIEENQLTLKYLIYTHSYKIIPEYYDDVKTDSVKGVLPLSSYVKQNIKIGNKNLKLFTTQGGYSHNSQLSVEIDDILIAGNIISTTDDKPTALIYSDLGYLIDTLEEIEDRNYSYIIPAYGEITDSKEIISDQLKLLKEDYSRNKIVEEYGWTMINDDIFVITGSYYEINLTLVVSGNEATIIDTGYNEDEAIMVKEYLERENITLINLIITHDHLDHRANIAEFKRDDVKYYDYHNTYDNQIITMGDKNMTIIYTPGHHNNDEHLSVDINNTILVAGDIINPIFDPTGLAIGGNKENLYNTLKKLKANNYSIIIPGHGKVSANDTIIREYINILEDIQ